MKKIVIVLSVVLLFSALVVSSSALTDLRVGRDLEEDQYFNLDTAIHCHYVCGWWFGNGWSSTECETSSDMFCYAWVFNIDRNNVEVFFDDYGYVSNRLVLPAISVSSTRYAKETWHGAYRTKNGVRNLDARVEIYNG